MKDCKLEAASISCLICCPEKIYLQHDFGFYAFT